MTILKSTKKHVHIFLKIMSVFRCLSVAQVVMLADLAGAIGSVQSARGSASQTRFSNTLQSQELWSALGVPSNSMICLLTLLHASQSSLAWRAPPWLTAAGKPEGLLIPALSI